jgi:hypothetical protein
MLPTITPNDAANTITIKIVGDRTPADQAQSDRSQEGAGQTTQQHSNPIFVQIEILHRGGKR